MSHIYISYRAVDSHQKAINRIVEHFTQLYGEDNVTRAPHRDALDTTHRQQWVQSHAIVLVIFGRYGLNMVDERGNRLLDDPYDPQHIEVSAALKHRLKIHTLVFDDMVDNLADHLPDVLKGLATKPKTTHLTNATLDDTLNKLTEQFDMLTVQPSTAQFDLSKMVAQPSRKEATATEQIPSTSQVQTAYPQIQIHASRNPLMRFLRRVRLQISGDAGHATQAENNANPNTNRPRVESYRQMWPTSFLVIVAVIGLSIFVAAMMQTDIPTSQNADFTLRQVATMGRGGDDVTFSADGSEVAHITGYGDVYHFNWETMDFPDRVNVRMSSPEQLAYGIENSLVMRNDSRIFVVNTHDYGGYIEHQYVAQGGVTILDMAVSQTSTDIVFVLDSGWLIHWDYGIGQISETELMRQPNNGALIRVSSQHNIIALLFDRAIHVYDMDTLNLIQTDNRDRYTFADFDRDEARLIAWTTSNKARVWQVDDWSSRTKELSHYDPSIDGRYANVDNFVYDSQYDRLVQHVNNRVIEWDYNRQPQYLGEYRLTNTGDIIQSIAISPDGRYLATGTLGDTIIWQLNIDE